MKTVSRLQSSQQKKRDRSLKKYEGQKEGEQRTTAWQKVEKEKNNHSVLGSTLNPSTRVEGKGSCQNTSLQEQVSWL